MSREQLLWPRKKNAQFSRYPRHTHTFITHTNIYDTGSLEHTKICHWNTLIYIQCCLYVVDNSNILWGVKGVTRCQRSNSLEICPLRILCTTVLRTEGGKGGEEGSPTSKPLTSPFYFLFLTEKSPKKPKSQNYQSVKLWLGWPSQSWEDLSFLSSPDQLVKRQLWKPSLPCHVS